MYFFLNKKIPESLINIGTGIEKSVVEYTSYIMKHLGVDLRIKYVNKKLDGTSRQLLDVSLANKYGWKYKTSLEKGISVTINDYLQKNIL